MKETTEIKATVKFLQNGAYRQKAFTAKTEEELIETIFLFQCDMFPEYTIEIKQVQYLGKILYWNDFLAQTHFAKGRMSFEEFKKACFDNPQKAAS